MAVDRFVRVIGAGSSRLRSRSKEHLSHPQRRQRPPSNSHSSSTLRAYSTSDVISEDYLKPGVEYISNTVNPSLLPALTSLLTSSPNFRLYSVDMLASCEYLPQELTECVSESCEVYPIDEDEVPHNVIKIDASQWQFDLDGWARWDMPTDDYYDTQDVPEAYTSYDGSVVWNFIHEKIAFKPNTFECGSWRRDFNNAISGLHSSISCHILMSMEEKIEGGEEDVEGLVFKDEFDRRLGTKDHVENLYFTYMLLLGAVREARHRLLEDCESDFDGADELRSVLSMKMWDSDVIDCAAAEMRKHGTKEDDTFWKARMRTRELMRIMNCVQCNKCRLHGKIGVLGLSTALQILLGKSGTGVDSKVINKLHRVELAALLTTTGKCGRAVMYYERKIKEGF
ncbi:hypothetical protein TrVE_jg7299 [Triparma verrucosa]|uniref:Endoplasmic reticulum oxidoreductin 1 n=1 Tax=Triparma verrucosa TaxID=1606542 RepID=A0A9W7C2T1_9STRA|nr:hypothetical protein TrVE_jg7299 [Triparma verrucosa]